MKGSSRMRASGIAVAGVVAIMMISSSALAQTGSTTKVSSDSTPKWDLFAGYQYTFPGGTVPQVPSNPAAPVPFTLPDMARGGGSALDLQF